jgi:hypothetical protein
LLSSLGLGNYRQSKNGVSIGFGGNMAERSYMPLLHLQTHERVAPLAMKVSTVPDVADTQTRDFDVERILTVIRTGGKEKRIGRQVEEIRFEFNKEWLVNGKEAAKEAIAPLKKRLPGVLWSGRFSTRADDALIEHTGLLCADLDGLNSDRDQVREKLLGSRYVWAMFVSPSGEGLKVIFRVPADPAKHKGSFLAIQDLVREITGREIDQSCKNVSRLCFLSHDPDLYFNPGAPTIIPFRVSETRLRALPPPELLCERQRIALHLLGNIEWKNESRGFVTCPGKHLHTTGDSKRDCEIHLNGAPTIHCFHDSCRGIVDGKNHELRSQIAIAELPTHKDADELALQRLAALPPLECERVRETEAKKLKCRASTLDQLVYKNRKNNGDRLQGSGISLVNVEPWPEPVNGAEVLEQIAETFCQYIALPDGGSDALALWCAHAHCFSIFRCSPRLNVSSPERNCGKTTLRDVISVLVPRPLLTENCSVAVLFRVIEREMPTLLADEYDSWLRNNEELRGMLNAGHRRGGQAAMRW